MRCKTIGHWRVNDDFCVFWKPSIGDHASELTRFTIKTGDTSGSTTNGLEGCVDIIDGQTIDFSSRLT